MSEISIATLKQANDRTRHLTTHAKSELGVEASFSIVCMGFIVELEQRLVMGFQIIIVLQQVRLGVIMLLSSCCPTSVNTNCPCG